MGWNLAQEAERTGRVDRLRFDFGVMVGF